MTPSIGWRYRFMIAILAITAYAPTLKTGFMWDDHVMIEANQSLQNPSWENIKKDWTQDVFQGHGDPYYRPFLSFSFRVDHALWGLHALGYHIVNLLFHLGNALLVAQLILVLGCTPLTAFVTGCLFAVHPIVVEQLMIVAGRAELMGLFFSLLTLLLFVRKERKYWLWGALTYALALFTKESSVTIPVLLGLVYYVRKEPRAPYAPILPMLLVLVPYLALRYAVVGPMILEARYFYTLRFFVQEFPSVLWGYLALIFVPWNLHSHRLLPHIHPLWPFYLLSLIALGWYTVKRYHRWAVFCLGWFIVSFLPKTPTMIYGNFMLEHWAYPATLAVCFPLASLIASGWRSPKNNTRSWTAAVFFSILIIWSLLVHLNVALRGSDEKILRWALRFTTSNPVKYNLGVELLRTGRAKEAIECFEDVRSVYPEDPRNAHALAMAYWSLGYRKLAVRQLEDFQRRYPHIPLPPNILPAMKKELSKK